jgi:1-acyl-sn-glycerol-3-phosphate acyltransferase
MEMLDAAAAALQNGQTLIIFPEGTRTHPAAPAFHRGPRRLPCAVRKSSPVVIKVSPTT